MIDGARPRHGIAGLRRTYLSLGTGELAAVVVFVVVQPMVAGRLDDAGGRALWWAMAPLLVILLQGSAYWLLARTWLPGAGRPGMPRGVALLYQAFRLLDPVLLAACLAGLLLTGPGPGALVLCLLVWAFGVLEYVNYFVVRLSYPMTQWFTRVGRRRTPVLVRDVARASS
ncbi:hypothetical protein ACQEVI_25740 [Promicromonospora sp. CA-289599]|uniref:hypothetical protein n=1 Tax=Promicromonospora sp. CA-289599 TaxID=3240014 RepID=UPI003D91C16A